MDTVRFLIGTRSPGHSLRKKFAGGIMRTCWRIICDPRNAWGSSVRDASHTCTYVLPMDFYRPFSQRLRSYLRYRPVVIASLSVVLGITVLVFIGYEYRPFPSAWAMGYGLFMLSVLIPIMIYAIVGFEMRTVILCLKIQYIHSSQQIDRIAIRQGRPRYGVQVNQTGDRDQCCKIKNCSDAKDAPVVYYLQNFM